MQRTILKTRQRALFVLEPALFVLISALFVLESIIFFRVALFVLESASTQAGPEQRVVPVPDFAPVLAWLLARVLARVITCVRARVHRLGADPSEQ